MRIGASCAAALPLGAGTSSGLTHAGPVQLAEPAPPQPAAKSECFLLTWCPELIQRPVGRVLAEQRRCGRIVWKERYRVADLDWLVLSQALGLS